MPEPLKHLLGRIAAIAQHAGLWVGLAVSVGLAVGSLVVAAAVVVSWSPDHFAHDAHRPGLWHQHPAPLRILAVTGKNLAGIVMFLLGLAMAFPGVPGQGILTMIIAVTLIDFPGKQRLERRLVGRPWVLRQLNAVRRRFHRAPLRL